MQKAGRNDPCPCGSGKKFKKCCELKQARGRFSATLLHAESAPQIQKTAALTSFFQASIGAFPRGKEPSILPLIEGKLEEKVDHLVDS